MSATLVSGGGEVICSDLTIADRPRTRMRGLLGRDSLNEGEGMLLRPAGSVHTAFMRFEIDVVYLDRRHRVIGVVHELRPWRMSGRRGARAVVELPAGEARRRRIEAGATLAVLAGTAPSADGR